MTISQFMIRHFPGITSKLAGRATRRNQARRAYRQSKKDRKAIAGQSDVRLAA